LNAKNKLIRIEQTKRTSDIIRYSSYSLLAGVIIGIIVSN